ncbi:MAG: SusC/RagA family TonB-linked outer membrane protein [Chitinophagaceae bacterium]|nr:SusC/RagA family TonB-linked outer membrane protein [Chitinophagaceae bacterium]
MKNAPVQQVFKEVSRQTGVSIMYAESLFKDMKPVSISVKDATVQDVLDLCLKGLPFEYNIKGNSIMISNAATILLQPAVTSLTTIPPPITVKGRIVSESGDPVIASIQVKGTQNGTSSNEEGYFELRGVDENAILIITGVNIAPLEVKVDRRSIIAVTVKVVATEGEDVIIKAGYYDIKEREMTGSIGKVDARTIDRQPVSNALQALQGRIPGLYIQQNSGTPGANFRVILRGRSSIINGNNPLYIIDGVPFSTEPLTSTRTSGQNLGAIPDAQGSSPINLIDPSDIESIEVLKDADATAIYGSRGANGVILISTKKGKSGRTNAEFSFSGGISNITRKIELMNSSQYLEMRREAFKNDGLIPTAANAADLMVWDTTRNTDWQEEFIGNTAHTLNAQFSISGGNPQTQFLLKGSYFRQSTVMYGDMHYSKLNSHFSIRHISPNKKFNADVSISYGTDKNNLPMENLAATAVGLPPVAPPLLMADGRLNWANSTWTNPVANLQRKYEASSGNLLFNTVMSYQITPDLQIKSNIGYTETQLDDHVVIPSTIYDPVYNAGPEYSSLTVNGSKNNSWIAEPQLLYTKRIGLNVFSALAGMTFQSNDATQTVISGVGFASNDLIDNINAASTVDVLDFRNATYRYNALFARVNYNLRGKYVINSTFRRDGSSRFGPGKQFANFAATGIAWIFSKEGFIAETPGKLSFGKLRASFGTTGNDQIGDYGYLDAYGLTTPYFGVTGLAPQRLFNPDFAWEVNRKLEFGIDLAFFKDRVQVSGGYYRNRSSNQLVGYPLPLTTGFASIQANLAATVQNSGIEIQIGSKNISGKSIEWNTSFNITVPSNKLISFPDLEKSTYATRFIIGEPITISRRYILLGVNPQTGIYQFEDMNGDGIITSADRLGSGNVSQKYYGGISNSIRINNLELNIFFQFVKQTGNSFLYSFFAPPGTRSNLPATILSGRWQKPGDIARFQKFSYFDFDLMDAQDMYIDSDATIVDASFIRLKNISVNYNLPHGWIKNVNGKLYLQGQNLLTFTKYVGSDPEMYSLTTMPPLRTIVAGIKIVF